VKLHLSAPGALNTFTGYGDGYVMVNGVRHETSLIVLPDRMLPWDATGFDALAESDFRVFLEMDLEILLLGTGPRQRFPDPLVLHPLARARVGVEVMDAQAACRTYNILMAESRKVAAALLMR